MREAGARPDEDLRTVAAVLPWIDDAEDLRRQRLVRAGLLFAVAAHVILLTLPLSEKQPGLRRLVLDTEPFRLAPSPAPRPPEPTPPPEPPAAEPPVAAVRVPVPELPEPVPIPHRPSTPPPLPALAIPADPGLAIPVAPPEPPGVVEWGAGIDRPERIAGADPLYTECARRVRLQGVVVLEAVIDRDGRAREVRILRDLGCGLGLAAANAVSSWTFRPATRAGAPLSVRYRLTTRFALR